MQPRYKYAHQIRELIRHLKSGWRINKSCRLAGISQKMHTELLRDPEYKSLIEQYKCKQKPYIDLILDGRKRLESLDS